jgi:hypothetical protein
MQEMSVPVTPSWIAEHYGDFLDGFIIDVADAGLETEIKALGMATMCTNIVMNSMDDRVQLASTSLEFIASLSQSDLAKAVSGE